MFEEGKLYRANDPLVTAVIPYSTGASWRYQGKGPPFLKVSNRVFFRGEDLNVFLDDCRVDPAYKRRQPATAAA